MLLIRSLLFYPVSLISALLKGQSAPPRPFFPQFELGAGLISESSDPMSLSLSQIAVAKVQISVSRDESARQPEPSEMEGPIISALLHPSPRIEDAKRPDSSDGFLAGNPSRESQPWRVRKCHVSDLIRGRDPGFPLRS
jgi:hypothetical protein